MKKLLVLTFVLASAVTVGLLLPGQDAEAVGCIKCTPGGTTGAAWGFGSTCQAATNDAISQASAMIPGTCDSCQETVIPLLPCDDTCSNPTTCYDPYGEWRVDVKIRYRCELDLCSP